MRYDDASRTNGWRQDYRISQYRIDTVRAVARVDWQFSRYMLHHIEATPLSHCPVIKTTFNAEHSAGHEVWLELVELRSSSTLQVGKSFR